MFGRRLELRRFDHEEAYNDKGRIQATQLPNVRFHGRAKTDEEILEHAKYHMAHVHGVIEVSPQMAKKIIESIKLVTVYVP